MHGSWTDEQLEAINSDGENLLVSAAAGSGKTAVLIERIIRIITDKHSSQADIDRLLVVTFTKAAAAEMKSRLRERLTDMLRADRENAVLQRQLALLPMASVSTFDALCQKIVRENFVLLDIDPSFKVGDEEELHLLRMQALDDVFEACYEKEDFRELIESVCEAADDFELREIVFSVFDFIQSERAPDKWLSEKAEIYDLTRLTDAICSKAAFEYAKSELNAALSSMKKGMELIEAGGLSEYSERFTIEAQMLENALYAEGYEQLADMLKAVFFDRLPGAKVADSADEVFKAKAQERRNDAKKKVSSIKEKYFFKDGDGLLEDMRSVYPVLKTLSETVGYFAERFMELKKERRILSFSDIKLLCYKALVGENDYTDAAREYQKLFEYVLVDEYQDTNDVEEGILEAVSRNSIGINNRFMVGDVKQSIYRFRQSKPELFIGKSAAYSEQNGGKLITLHKNFRSREFILNSVNFIFSQIMTRNAAEIEYDKSAELVGGKPQSGMESGAVEIALIETDTLEDGGDGDAATEAVNELKALEVEAAFIADKISTLVSGGHAKLGDIVILMRSGKRNGPLVSDMLSRKGIPSYSDEKSGYFELSEISDTLSLLNIIDNPLQEIPLLTALTSPIWSFSAEELIEIRAAKGGSFYDALVEYSATSAETPLSKKVGGFLRKLSEYRKMASETTISELLSYLFDDTNYYIICGAMRNGAQRQSNLRELLKRAADFEKSTFPSLFHFVRYMERLKERNMLGRPETAAGEISGAVRIMTVHKSKGLEFPVVFLAGCGSKFNLRDLSDKFILHQELGYGAVYVDWRNRTKTDTLPRAVVRERLRREALAEEMRLLYVAITRAKERLYITGSAGKDAARSIEKWLDISSSNGAAFSPEAVLSAHSYVDWIMPAILRSPCAHGFLEEYGLSSPSIQNEYRDRSSFAIEVVKRSEAAFSGENAQSGNDGQVEEKISSEQVDTSCQIDIDKTLNWKYNYEAATKLPVKLSVSEIKTQYQRQIAGEAETGLTLLYEPEETAILSKPVFMQERKGLTPSEKGTAVHSVLARLDLAEVRCGGDVQKLMEELLAKKILNEKEFEAVNISDVVRFIESEAAERIRCSENVRREVPFVISISPEEAYLPASKEEVLVHGIIDCFFEENGKIIIMDYKTDYVENEDFKKVKQKYRIQLDIYKRAAEKITQKPVSEAYLYMMRYGRLINTNDGELA